MEKKIGKKLILLIDDNQYDNYLHQIVIDGSLKGHSIVSITSAEKAITFLTTPFSGQYPMPDLIFLDINIPGMDGWEFLDQFSKLDETQTGKPSIYLLTTSDNPTDRQRAEQHAVVAGYLQKPLTMESLREIFGPPV